MANYRTITIPNIKVANVETLLEKIPDFNISDIFIHIEYRSEREITLALHAVENKDEKLLDYLINKNVDLNVVIPDIGTALHRAVFFGDLSLVKKLHRAGANINARKSDNWATPLALATLYGFFEIAKYLAENGADLHAAAIINESKCGHTPILIATHKGYENIVELLLRNGADPCAEITIPNLNVVGVKKIFNTSPNININSFFIYKDSNYRPLTLTHLAAITQKEELLDFLISAKAELNISIPSHGTALLEATKTGNINLVKKLCESGADPNYKQILTKTPLAVAANKCFVEITKYLIKKGADVNAQCIIPPFEGHTALHFAAIRGHKNIVEVLLKNNADPNIRTESGLTPIAGACSCASLDIVKILVAHGGICDTMAVKCAASFLYVSVELLEYLLALDIDAIDNYLTEKISKDPILHHALENLTNVSYSAPDQSSIKVILDAGVNINCVNYKNELAVDIASEPEILDCIKRHIVKLKQANFDVCLRNRQAVERDYDQFYSNECNQEIVRLKRNIVGKSNSVFYQVLCKNFHSLSIRFSHTNIGKIVDKKKLLNAYPIYGGIVYYKLAKVRRRIKLLKEAEEFLDYILNYCSKLPYTFTRELYFYLTNENLRKLI